MCVYVCMCVYMCEMGEITFRSLCPTLYRLSWWCFWIMNTHFTQWLPLWIVRLSHSLSVTWDWLPVDLFMNILVEFNFWHQEKGEDWWVLYEKKQQQQKTNKQTNKKKQKTNKNKRDVRGLFGTYPAITNTSGTCCVALIELGNQWKTLIYMCELPPPPHEITQSAVWHHEVCIYPTVLPWAGYDTRSAFKWSTACLNSEW